MTTTLRPLVGQLSGSLAHGVRRIDQFLQEAAAPQKMVGFEHELPLLRREVGRRIMTWVLNHLEPDNDQSAPALLCVEGRLYRRRRKHRRVVATLFGPVERWRRLYEPRKPGGRSLPPLELTVGIEAGLATPALAERVGRWATDHTQHQGLDRLEKDHGVPGSCTPLRKLLGSLRTGMAPHRHGAQVDQVVRWLDQARASRGRFRPPLAVGRDGIFVPLRHGVWQEGATAPVSVLDRRGKRVGTVYLGGRPESAQETLTAQLSALLQDILRRIDSQALRLVSVTDEGDHPRDSYHRVLKKMTAPRRPWRPVAWIRILDDYHACQYVQQRADARFGGGAEAQRWAKDMRHQLKTTTHGVARVLQSAAALRRARGLVGQAKTYDQSYGYLKKRSHWMRSQSYRRQKLPMGSGITEAACKIVFTQRLKRSGMSWTIAGGQVSLDLRVMWLSGIWEDVHQRYLMSKPMPVAQVGKEKGNQRVHIAA